jgi:hypothetical protein
MSEKGPVSFSVTATGLKSPAKPRYPSTTTSTSRTTTSVVRPPPLDRGVAATFFVVFLDRLAAIEHLLKGYVDLPDYAPIPGPDAKGGFNRR